MPAIHVTDWHTSAFAHLRVARAAPNDWFMASTEAIGQTTHSVRAIKPAFAMNRKFALEFCFCLHIKIVWPVRPIRKLICFLNLLEVGYPLILKASVWVRACRHR